MKKILPAFLLVGGSIYLCGCPYDSPYNLDESPSENIDESLLGRWTTTISRPVGRHASNARGVTVFFEKRTEMEYDIVITGAIEPLKTYDLVSRDSIKGTAYLSSLGGRRFFNAYIHGKVYLAELVKDSSFVSILPLAEYFTSKLVRNSKELHKALEFHYRVALQPAYDPLFSLVKLHRQD
jgi:hypothetical protein